MIAPAGKGQTPLFGTSPWSLGPLTCPPSQRHWALALAFVIMSPGWRQWGSQLALLLPHLLPPGPVSVSLLHGSWPKGGHESHTLLSTRWAAAMAASPIHRNFWRAPGWCSILPQQRPSDPPASLPYHSGLYDKAIPQVLAALQRVSARTVPRWTWSHTFPFYWFSFTQFEEQSSE